MAGIDLGTDVERRSIRERVEGPDLQGQLKSLRVGKEEFQLTQTLHRLTANGARSSKPVRRLGTTHHGFSETLSLAIPSRPRRNAVSRRKLANVGIEDLSPAGPIERGGKLVRCSKRRKAFGAKAKLRQRIAPREVRVDSGDLPHVIWPGPLVIDSKQNAPVLLRRLSELIDNAVA